MYDFGDIVLVPFPFTDLSSSKLRPALIVSAKSSSEDVIVAFIGSDLSKNRVHLSIQKGEDYFSHSGLKVDSVIRFDKLATLSKGIILGKLGDLPKDFLRGRKNDFYTIFGF